MLPRNFHALNLLPDDEKRMLKRLRTLSFVREFLTLFFVFTILGSGAILAARLTLEEAFGKAVVTSTPGFREVTVLNRKIRAVNRWIDLHERVLHPQYTSWPQLFAELDRAIPKNSIQVQTLTASDDDVLTIAGVAKTRDDLLKLRSNLKELPLIKDVTLPLQSLAQETNAPFSLSARLNRKNLKIKL